MKLLNKILKKIDNEFENYHEIINWGLPVLFCIEKKHNVNIGFVNRYRPTRGEISFILTKTYYSEIRKCIENNSNVRGLFKGDIVSYTYSKGKIGSKIVSECEFDKYLPSEELLVQEVPNDINLVELLVKLQIKEKGEQIEGGMLHEVPYFEYHVESQDEVKYDLSQGISNQSFYNNEILRQEQFSVSYLKELENKIKRLIESCVKNDTVYPSRIGLLYDMKEFVFKEEYKQEEYKQEEYKQDLTFKRYDNSSFESQTSNQINYEIVV
ncbi:hypothetical protein [Streptococcus salivarius]